MTRITAKAKITHGAELEIRFGSIRNGKFSIGCSADAFNRIHNKLVSNDAVVRTEWTQTRSCTFPENIRVIHGLHEQTTVIQKRCIASLMIPTGRDIAFKLSLAVELPYNDAPPTTPPMYTRLRDRQQFFHGHGGRRTWAYDFTRTQGAETEELARLTNTVYEIELELIDTKYIQETDACQIAKTILHRATELAK